jgi:hypothetical protein
VTITKIRFFQHSLFLFLSAFNDCIQGPVSAECSR